MTPTHRRRSRALSDKTSAAPDLEESARLPCLATGTPAPATMNAAQVEMLNDPDASPPISGALRQDIRRAGLGGERPVTVLGNWNAGAGDNECGAGRNVE